MSLLGLLGQAGAPSGTNKTTTGLRLPPFLMHASGCGGFGFYFPGFDSNGPNNEASGDGSGREKDASFVSSYGKFVMYNSACRDFHTAKGHGAVQGKEEETDSPILSRQNTAPQPTSP